MRSFYLVALGCTAALALTPFVLLEEEVPLRLAGRTIVYDVYATKIRSVDPATCGDVASAQLQANFYEGLYAYHYLKRPLQVVPQLAREMPEISPDGLTYTIRLKPDVVYAPNPCFGTDGRGRPKTRAVRAEDFVLAFQRIADFHITTGLSLSFVADKIQGLSAYRQATRRYHRGDFSRYDKEALPGVRALDENTLRIRLVKPYPQLLMVLAMHQYAPVPREGVDYHLAGGGKLALSERDPSIRQREAIVGTGPYVMTQWVRAGKIVLERNENFRHDVYPSEGAPGDAAAGLLDDAGRRVPFVDAWDLTFVPEANPQWMLFLSRQRDIGEIPEDVFQSVIGPSQELTDRMAREGIRLLKSPDAAIRWLAFNMRDPVLGASKSLRQAICVGYDVETHVEVLRNGRGRRALTAVPSTFGGCWHDAIGPVHGPWFWRDLDAPRHALDAALRDGDAGQVDRARRALAEARKREQARALAKAKEKMADARRELEAAGVLSAGEPFPALTLDLGHRDESARRFAQFARGQLAQLGLELKVVLNDWPTLQQKVKNKQVRMYSKSWFADYPDAENFLQLFYSPNIRRGTNDTNFRNAEFDRLYEQAAVLPNPADRRPLYAKMLRILNDQCPALPLYEPMRFTLIHPWVHNVKPHPIAYGFGKYRRVDTAMRRRLGGR